VKILQRIVDARQVNLNSRDKLINGIRREEKSARGTRDALMRADLRKMSEIAASNQKFAVKLFTSKPTYQVHSYEQQYVKAKANANRISRFIHVPEILDPLNPLRDSGN